jgi:tetratricopeptide (TPR) repeat protein
MGIGVDIDHAGALLGERRVSEAIALLSKVVAKRPRESRAVHMLGVAHALSGRHSEAETYLRQAKTLKPQSAQILTDLAALYTTMKRDREALPLLETACKREPGFTLARFYCGVALSNLGRNGEALDIFTQLSAADPFNIVYLQNRAALLAMLERYDEADVVADQVLKRQPTMPEALLAKAVTATARGNLDEGLEICERILARDRNFVKAIVHRGYIRLLRGQWLEAWPDYEARFERDGVAPPLPDVPIWTGEPLEGRSILVFAEQGLGDSIMMSRYLPLLRDRGADVVYSVRSPLKRLLRGIAEGTELVDSPPARRMDFQIGELSLPYRFGNDVSTVPAKTPYLFAEPEKVAHWKNVIGDHGFKVGIVWFTHASDSRAIPLREFLPLSQVEGVRLISLQKHGGLDQLADLPAGMRVETLGEDFDSGGDAFIDTAGAMQNLDLVITCDTSIGPLAGSLGRPVWVAHKMVPEWRWMVGREDCPWYPDLRIVRQTKPGVWSDVFERMADDLRRRTS